jgi:radical SAM-linked protein
MVRDKVRIRFRKTGDLRLISHHDLMRCFERMLRRAALPFHSTEGFNPKPRLIFALPLSLGTVGHQEVVELELDAELAPDEIQARLKSQAPAGLEFLSVERISGKTTAHVRSVCYRLAVPPERHDELRKAMATLLQTTTCWIERSRPRPRRIDVRPYLRGLNLSSAGLEMELLVTPNGAVRPEEILHLLDLKDLVDAGTVIERIKLELEDEENRNHAGDSHDSTIGIEGCPSGTP